MIRFDLWCTMHQNTVSRNVSAIFLYMYFICMSYGSLSPYFTHLHQDYMWRTSFALPSLPQCMLHGVYMDSFTFFPFLSSFYREKTVYSSPVFLSCHLYTRLFSLLKFKESQFSANWNVLFLESKHCDSMSDAWVSCATIIYNSKLCNSFTYQWNTIKGKENGWRILQQNSKQYLRLYFYRSNIL